MVGTNWLYTHYTTTTTLYYYYIILLYYITLLYYIILLLLHYTTTTTTTSTKGDNYDDNDIHLMKCCIFFDLESVVHEQIFLTHTILMFHSYINRFID